MKERSIEQINNKIKKGSVIVVTAEEMTQIAKENGIEKAYEMVDIVTCATFGAMCSSGVFLNFGHSDPPIKMTDIWLNDVPVYGGLAAVDGFIGATALSQIQGMNYGGAHVIEDLINGKRINLKAVSHGTDCYPRRYIETTIDLMSINQAIMLNPRNSYQKYNAATNTGKEEIYTYMGKLLPDMGNVTYSGSGELSPLNNDPDYETIGIGTRIFLGGDKGYIIGNGTQHSPENGYGTLMVKGNLKNMSSEFIKAAIFKGYGVTLYIGIGVPIPLLNVELARKTSISDDMIYTNIIDYGIAQRSKPIIKRVNYKELKSGYVYVKDNKIKTASLSSLFIAKKIADILKTWIKNGQFFLTSPVEKISSKGSSQNLEINENLPSNEESLDKKKSNRKKIQQYSKISLDNEKCISCGYCLTICSFDVFNLDSKNRLIINPEKCTLCGNCKDICPLNAIELGVLYV